MSDDTDLRRNDGAVRLSTYVIFVDYGSEVEIQHTVRATSHRVNRVVYEDLLGFRSFGWPRAHHVDWITAGVLVRPFEDTLDHHGGPRAGSEAKLGRDYQEWYWRHEIESEREYRWLGWNVVKMPADLFFYQELITKEHFSSVLEIGYGNGGGIWFFATILAQLGGGHVVGVDRQTATDLPPVTTFDNVHVNLIHQDAHTVSAVSAVCALRPTGFGLVVIDADPRPAGKIALLTTWAPAVCAGGYLVLEDVDSPLCTESSIIGDGIDRFLLANPSFGIVVAAARFPLLKARGAILQRIAH
jgi:cephalosporin hydroxylase